MKDLPSPPELLAPAGDLDCVHAAVENGADAVYFGLQQGLNARARAVNFSTEELPDLMAYLHRRGVKGYVTLNTLVFPGELEEFERLARLAITAGVDAALVQDLGAARLLKELSPDWPLHASTQMSLTSAEGIHVAAALGIQRVVLARELSLAEIRQIRLATEMELEVFVHGALCIGYSGQCLASLAMGGRSGNRGQCAQACRLPYDMICDGKPIDHEGRRYLYSPLDLAAYDLMPELLAAGVHAVKIEGRMKSPEYVAATTRHYRHAIDEAVAGRRLQLSAAELEELQIAFSRGFSHGWLEGNTGRRLVPGDSSANRGVPLGEVLTTSGDRVVVRLAAPVKRGDGVVFEGDRHEGEEVGGRIYEVFVRGKSIAEPVASGIVELAFGRDALAIGDLRPGQRLWKTDDPQLARRLRQTFEGRQSRSLPVDLVVEASVGRPLRVRATVGTDVRCRLDSEGPLAEATKHVVTPEVLREQLGRLGGTTYLLRSLDARIIGRPMVPLSVLGQIRRELVQQLDELLARPPARQLAAVSPLVTRCAAERRAAEATPGNELPPVLHILCRSVEQVGAALELGGRELMAEFTEIADYGTAIAAVRQRGAAIFLATPRIQKPGEQAFLARLASLQPDGLLVRTLAAADFCRHEHIPFVADFSLHAANPLSVEYLCQLGAIRVTAAYDLDRGQLLELAGRVPAGSLEVVVRQHIPMFHSEHCLFSAGLGLQESLSAGQGRAGEGRAGHSSACGRSCRQHELLVRDRRGVAHPLRVDALCRNTLYHADVTDLADLVPQLMAHGVRHFRVEMLDGESPAVMRKAVTSCREALRRPRHSWADAQNPRE